MQYIKDLRRGSFTVTRDVIVIALSRIMPEFVNNRTYDACLSSYNRFMARNGLTIRRITQSGRDLLLDLEAKKLIFTQEVVDLLTKAYMNPSTRLQFTTALYNMHKTSDFCIFPRQYRQYGRPCRS